MSKASYHTPDDVAVKVMGLTKRFGNLTAVNDLSFDIKKGELFGFLGPNGAGKTTTIRMLTGLTKPTSGTAAIEGFDVVKQTVKAKGKMGVVPEVSNIFDEMSAWDNLILSAQLYGIPQEERGPRAKELLENNTGLAMPVPERSINGIVMPADKITPNKTPAIAFPEINAKKGTGATINLSKVPVCFSNTTATASIDVVPNSTASAVNPEIAVERLTFPASENAKNNEIGINNA